MKRKDLYNYIKEEIVGILTEDATAIVTSKAGSKPVTYKNPTELDALKKDSNVSSIITTGGQKIKEAELEEMANVISKIKIQDTAKFALAKEIYSSGLTKELLDALEAAGEEGMTQKELGAALNLKNDSDLNPVITNLRTAGALTPKRDKIVKSEKTSSEVELELPTLTPDEEPEEEPIDTFYKDDEEETPEEKPETVDDKELEKTIGKSYADLTPEEEKTYEMYKQAIINKAKILSNKKASKDDKIKAKASIDKYKTNADLKKIFNKKGIDLIKFISGRVK